MIAMMHSLLDFDKRFSEGEEEGYASLDNIEDNDVGIEEE